MRYLSFLFLFLSTISFAQNPQVLDVFPANQAVNAAADGVISVNFDLPINPASMTYGNFKVFGRWSGPAELSFSMTNNNQTIEMTPFEPLMAGEWVTVMLSKNIESADGEKVEQAYAWNFWIATKTAVDAVSFSLEKTIELRQAGEGLIQAYGAYAGDLNNDGYSDLTVVNETSDDLRILLNDGAGDYNDFEIITLGDNTTPSPNEGGDFNNDGEIDLAVCTAHDDDLRVLFGDGSGTLSNMDNYTTGTNARGLGVIDFDGDGNDDIIIANRGSSDLTLFHNDGFGEFTATTFDSPGTGESGLVVTDFNNDGIQDIILGMYNSNEIVVMLGDGEMGFTTTAQVPVNGQPWMLATGDLNGDGTADVVSANSSANNVAVLLNDGSNGFSTPTYLAENNADFPLAIDLGDLDGDGDLDMVTSYYSSVNFWVFYNDGTGTFTAGQVLGAGSHASCAILHDRDNDGDLDITGTDEGDDIVLLYDNNSPLVSTQNIASRQSFSAQPNPFNETVQIRGNENCSNCQLSVYNNLGMLLTTMHLNAQGATTWNGRNGRGDQVTPGVYFLKIGNASFAEILKVVKVGE